MTWIAMLKLVPWRYVSYLLIAVGLVVLGWRVTVWRDSHVRALPEARQALEAELACLAGSQCQRRVEAAVARQNENTIEVLNDLEAELVAVRSRPPERRVIRVCPDPGAGGVRVPGTPGGPDDPSAPAVVVSGPTEFDPAPLFELAREADELAARLRHLQQWNAALSEGPPGQ